MKLKKKTLFFTLVSEKEVLKYKSNKLCMGSRYKKLQTLIK